MSTVVRPVGPESPQTYWLRRFVVGIIVIVVLGMLVGVFRTIFGGDGAGAGSGSSSPTPVAACSPGNLTLTAIPAATNLTPGEATAMSARIQNMGKTACSVDVGAKALELTIVSGSDRIFSSQDCPSDAEETRFIVLQAGAEESVSLPWNGLRSAEGCPSELPQPRPGTYKASVSIEGTTSDPTTFRLQ